MKTKAKEIQWADVHPKHAKSPTYSEGYIEDGKGTTIDVAVIKPTDWDDETGKAAQYTAHDSYDMAQRGLSFTIEAESLEAAKKAVQLAFDAWWIDCVLIFTEPAK